VEALINMMTGDSIRMANAKATPYAARLIVGSAILAMMAAKKGPSVAIISHWKDSGSQNRKIDQVDLINVLVFFMVKVS
jgi:hypothetical protein